MFRQSKRRIIIGIVLAAVLSFTGFSAQQDESNVFQFDDFQKESVKIGNGLYEVNAEGKLSVISTVGYAAVLGDYLIFYRRSRPDELIIRTKDNINIDANARKYKWGLRAVMSYGRFVVASIVDERGYSDTFILLSIDQNTVRTIKTIDTTALLEVNGSLGERFIIDYSYDGIQSDRRLRGNVLFYFNKNKSYVFQIVDAIVQKIGEADSPLTLFIPELDGYREAIIAEGKLFIHDFGTGSNVLLGVPITDAVLPSLFSYTINNERFLFDSKSLTSYPAPESIDYASGFDGGYYYLKEDSEQHTVNLQFKKFDYSFYYSDDGGKTVHEVLRLKNSHIIENVTCQNGRLYISAWYLGLVYDIAQKKIVEAYVPEDKNLTNGYKWIVFVQPLGGKTYVHLREPLDYPPSRHFGS